MKTGLYGPHTLTHLSIDSVVKGIGPGVYALGSMSGDTFMIEYIGRSDSDLNGRLKSWVGKKYLNFKYGFLDSDTTAFNKECNMYHDFGGDRGAIDNSIHPQRPNGTNWQCPRCSVFLA